MMIVFTFMMDYEYDIEYLILLVLFEYGII